MELPAKLAGIVPSFQVHNAVIGGCPSLNPEDHGATGQVGWHCSIPSSPQCSHWWLSIFNEGV
jgi:hypothetical protein